MKPCRGFAFRLTFQGKRGEETIDVVANDASDAMKTASDVIAADRNLAEKTICGIALYERDVLRVERIGQIYFTLRV